MTREPGRRSRLFRLRRSRRRELDEEIRVHLEMRTEELIARGWDPDEAEREARRRFGSLEEARRDMARSARARDLRLRLRGFLDSLVSDLRLALRRAGRSPGFTLLSVLTLALGLGLALPVLTVVDQVLLRPLPFPEPDRLVVLMSVPERGEAFRRVSSENWLDWDGEATTLEASAIWRHGAPRVELGERVIRPRAVHVSPAFFDVLRPPTVRGRTFGADEVEGGERPLVVTRAFWRERMGSPELPADLRLGGAVLRVVGVVDPVHAYPRDAEIWIPGRIGRRGFEDARNHVDWEAVGRLAAGATLEEAKAELDAVALGIRESSPTARYSWGVGVRPLGWLIVEDVRRSLLLLLGGVGAVLLVACLNLAGLSAARTLDRREELDVRVALGAGRRRVVRLLLVEHLALAAAGGALGLGFGAWALGLVQRHSAGLLPRAAELGLDGRALAVAAVLTVAAGTLSGAIPAARAGRRSSGRLTSGVRGAGRGGHRAGAVLVGAELAVALTVLVAGGLLLRSFGALLSRDTGFDAEGVLMAQVFLDRGVYGTALDDGPAAPGASRRLDFWGQVMDGVAGAAGVRAVGAASGPPTFVAGTGFIEVDGDDDPDAGAGYRVVLGDYFEALEIPLLEGRRFDESDGPGTERVVVVNRTMAESYWPGESPVGKRVRALSMERLPDGTVPWLRVIGVVGDVRHDGHADAPAAEMFVLGEQVPYWLGAMTIVADGGDRIPPGLPEAVRAAVREADPALPVEISTLEQRLRAGIAERAFLTSLLALFAVLALALAGIGVYGLLAFLVARRTREIGIRTALGADVGRVVRLIFLRTAGVALAGIGVGVVGAVLVTRLLGSFVVDVEVWDPWTWASAVGIVLLASAAASVLPAWRAARIDPMIALEAG